MDPKPLDPRRSKLRYRSWHRGMLEVDLLLGQFADRHLASLTEAQLDDYELLLEQDCIDLWRWATQREPVPPELRNDVTAMLMKFRPLPRPQ